MKPGTVNGIEVTTYPLPDLSAMVREFLESKLNEDEDHQQRVLALKELYQKNHGKNRKSLTPLTRDEIYDERLRGH